MLAKVISLKNSNGGRVSSERGVRYIFKAGDLERSPFGGSFNLDLGEIDLTDPADRKLAVQMMNYTAEAGRLRNRFTSNPFYHYAISWRENEHPTPAQCREAAAHTLKAVGLHENQAVWALHVDRDHHWHLHVFANRVHPERLHLAGPPRFDFLALDKACREIELKQGWAHDRGPYVVLDGEIKRMSKRERERLGLRNADRAPTPGARAAEVHAGVPSLAEWLRVRAKDELLAAQNWTEFHKTLADRGCTARLAGGGIIIETRLPDGRTTSTKASGIHYSLSLGRLEKKFGAPFVPPAPDMPSAPLAKTYVRFVENVRAGTEPDLQEIPGRTGGSSPEREARRAERALARKALAEAYKRETEAQKLSRKTLVASLRKRHANERAALRQELKTIKATRIADLAAEHGSKKIAQGLWAAEAVVRRQELQRRQAAERAAVNRDLSRIEWVDWLEHRAAAGDDAAAAALRGIRYRESREKNKTKNGIEGEDLEPLRAATAGSIGGTQVGAKKEKSFVLDEARVRIDRTLQRIEYFDGEGVARITDSGPRVDVHVADSDTIDSGLLLAAQKFGGEVYITGDAAFREQAARRAARLGIAVKDSDLQHIVAAEIAQIEGRDLTRKSRTHDRSVQR